MAGSNGMIRSTILTRGRPTRFRLCYTRSTANCPYLPISENYGPQTLSRSTMRTFVHAFAPIAARLHNKTVKELFGQVALQHRNRLRVRNTVIFVLSVLTVASCAASFIAWRNFTESRSNELAAYSSQWLSRDPTIAFRLAEQGNVM